MEILTFHSKIAALRNFKQIVRRKINHLIKNLASYSRNFIFNQEFRFLFEENPFVTDKMAIHSVFDKENLILNGFKFDTEQPLFFYDEWPLIVARVTQINFLVLVPISLIYQPNESFKTTTIKFQNSLSNLKKKFCKFHWKRDITIIVIAYNLHAPFKIDKSVYSLHLRIYALCHMWHVLHSNWMKKSPKITRERRQKHLIRHRRNSLLL